MASTINFLRLIADPTRLRLLNLMAGREVCVCYFVEILKQGQPKISRHLAYLRRAGIVRALREGKLMHYRISEPVDSQAAQVFKDVRNWLSSNPTMQRERGRLVNICCTKPPAHLANAPKPVFANFQ